MSIVFGIILLCISGFWLIVALQVRPGTTHTNQGYFRPGATSQNTGLHFLLGLALTVGFLIGGLALLF